MGRETNIHDLVLIFILKYFVLLHCRGKYIPFVGLLILLHEHCKFATKLCMFSIDIRARSERNTWIVCDVI
jgi:hypothetical protein